jgi:hypothetical protein
MRWRAVRRRQGFALLNVVLLASATAGCQQAGTITGLVAGGAAGGATANPAIGYAVAVGTAAAADEAFKYYGRVTQNAEQDAIAAAAGTLTAGEVAPWHIDHTIPIGDEHGQVRLVRDIPNPLATCREIAFDVVAGKREPPAWYTATICRQPERWKWALAEPAVPRWGYLQ